MPVPNEDLPSRHLKTPEAARFLGLSAHRLVKHRTYGTGPRHSGIGRRVVHAVDGLLAWVTRGE
jgi:predicted DNA-binding transcriptional regulator AlpA